MSFLVDVRWEKNKKAQWRAASMYLLKIAPDSFRCHVAPLLFYLYSLPPIYASHLRWLFHNIVLLKLVLRYPTRGNLNVFVVHSARLMPAP